MNEIKTAKEIPRFGEIYFAEMDNQYGSIQHGLRPVLIAQNNIGNKHSPTVTVIPLTAKMKANYMPTHICITDYHECGLFTKSVLMVEQIQTINKSQLMDKIGSIPKDYYGRIADAIKIQIPFLSPS